MNNEKLKMLNNYIKSRISPILLEDIPLSIFQDVVILESDCDRSLLNGHYEGINFVPPNWYVELIEKSENYHPVLVINNINKVSKIEQSKFIEIFKYKKISTFHLPKNCIIIATCSNLKENPISEEVYSLMAHI